MSRYIRQYISTCDLCLRTKLMRQALVGELHPLQIPDSWWDTLSVDFVVELPLFSEHDTVMTVVDSVSKRAHFIPMHMIVIAEGAARLFLHQVWKLHGLLKCVISDYGPQFIACFTKELYCLLGIKLVSSTAWHSQTNRQTEHINQELDQYSSSLWTKDKTTSTTSYPWQSSSTIIMSTLLLNSLCFCLTPDSFLVWALNPNRTLPV